MKNTICLSLGSGSSGNSYFVHAGKTGILVDAGFSYREIERRLRLLDLSPDLINALFVTHEHNDHASGVGAVARRLKLPVYMSEGTATSLNRSLHKLDINIIEAGRQVGIGDLAVKAFSLSHDAIEPLGFSIYSRDGQVTILTDTGQILAGVIDEVWSSSILFLEANHDIGRLITGRYPKFLQRRIASDQGHLSNIQAAELLAKVSASGLQAAMLAHLSAENNSPAIAYQTITQYLGDERRIKLGIAYRDVPSLQLVLSKGCLVSN